MIVMLTKPNILNEMWKLIHLWPHNVNGICVMKNDRFDLKSYQNMAFDVYLFWTLK